MKAVEEKWAPTPEKMKALFLSQVFLRIQQ